VDSLKQVKPIKFRTELTFLNFSVKLFTTKLIIRTSQADSFGKDCPNKSLEEKMIRKSLFVFFLMAALSLVAFAQTAPVRGVVEMTQADGKKVPVVGALIECFRTDIKGKFPGPKTDKKGVFVFAGLPLGGLFTLSVSGQGISPQIYPNVKAGREDIVILVNAGDGKRLTEDEVRNGTATAVAKNGGGELTAEQKKLMAEEQKKIDAVKANNAKIEESNKIILRVYDEGNVALKANNYDLAIAKFSEGIAADASHPGTPALLINRSNAYRRRGVDRYNVAIKPGGEGLDAAKQDFIDAADSAKAAIELLKTQTPPTDAEPLKNFKGYKYNSSAAYAEGMRLVATKADQSRVADLITAYQDFLAIETDPVQKAKTQLTYAQALMDSQDLEKAAAEFEKVLVDTPNDVTALSGAGLCLVSLGYISNDKAKFQNGANYLARYIELAPDSDPVASKYKVDAKNLLETLKKEQNVTAQKPAKTTPVKKKP
jgi:tetratricopeptide (TPR) repeat protein